MKLSDYRISPGDLPNEGILFIDHSKENRSGHLGHALVEYRPGEILAFYANCSTDDKGHSAVGWTEYARSLDGGQTWSEGRPLPYTKELFDANVGKSAFAEKAVVTDDGTIIVFCLVCDISNGAIWEPYFIPVYLKSIDGGETWSAPCELSPFRGRCYDVLYRDGVIYALEFCNDATMNFVGVTDEHIYRLYVSENNGMSFQCRSAIPFNTKDRGYGTMEFLRDGRLVVYIYNNEDEYHLDFIVSDDLGFHWQVPQKTAYFAKKIRNPQLICFDRGYFMHGRSGSWGEEHDHFVLYYSEDGFSWDTGTYMALSKEGGQGAYSNSIVVGKRFGQAPGRLLIQASHAYQDDQTNILHWWIDTKS